MTRALIAAVGGSALLAGLDKIPGWDFISQCLAIGAAIGLAVAYHAKRLDPNRITRFIVGSPARLAELVLQTMSTARKLSPLTSPTSAK